MTSINTQQLAPEERPDPVAVRYRRTAHEHMSMILLYAEQAMRNCELGDDVGLAYVMQKFRLYSNQALAATHDLARHVAEKAWRDGTQ